MIRHARNYASLHLMKRIPFISHGRALVGDKLTLRGLHASTLQLSATKLWNDSDLLSKCEEELVKVKDTNKLLLNLQKGSPDEIYKILFAELTKKMEEFEKSSRTSRKSSKTQGTTSMTQGTRCGRSFEHKLSQSPCRFCTCSQVVSHEILPSRCSFRNG